jgi:alkylated DNA repair dioxygenase AlkB
MSKPSGLIYFDDAVSEDFGRLLIRWTRLPSTVEKLSAVSSSQSARKVLQYGYRYNYQSGRTREPGDDFPHIINLLRSSIPHTWTSAPRGVEERLNQCIINFYQPGQGIGAHIDRKEFGGVVVCFTFGSGREMEFSRGEDRYTVYTRPLSMYVMTGESRYEWKHEMRGRLTDRVNGNITPRGECFSVTFREVPE